MTKKNKLATEKEVSWCFDKIKELSQGLNSILFGQEEIIELVIIGIISRGHLLLEGLPGLGKTELVKGLSQVLDLDNSRIQFTPDLLPGDITGNPILQEKKGSREFVFQKGPIFSNLVLADEINRASPKTQSALLEAMQERRVTVFGKSHELPIPFFVIATQNPIELEGTYPLPEAQVDRFLFKINIENNDTEVLEKIINERELGIEPHIDKVINKTDFLKIIEISRKVFLPEVVANYIARIISGTHKGNSGAAEGIKYGASPRAALSLASAVKARALINNRINASFEDVKFLAPSVLNHRIIMSYNAKINNKTPKQAIAQLLEEIKEQDLSLPKTLN